MKYAVFNTLVNRGIFNAFINKLLTGDLMQTLRCYDENNTHTKSQLHRLLRREVYITFPLDCLFWLWSLIHHHSLSFVYTLKNLKL